MKDAPSTPLTFHWPGQREVSLAKPVFFLIAVALHLAGLYVFQITYPASARLQPPPAQVSLLAPTSEENRALLRWVDSQDPALLFRPVEIIPASLRESTYTPSYAVVKTTPQLFTAPREPAAFPPARDPLALMLASVAPAHPETAPIPGPATRVTFTDALAPRANFPPPAWPAQMHSRMELKPARFLLGINARGEVAYLFPQEPSGDPALDRAAESLLHPLRFTDDPAAPIAWGEAVIHWGVDALGR